MRGNELLEQMALVDPAYVAEADVVPKKKNRNMWRAVAAILCVVLCGGLTYYIVPFLSLGNPPDGPYPVTGMNSPWEFEGGSITITGVTVTDSYLAPDGTTYSQDDDDVLVIVKWKAVLDPEWSVAGTYLTTHFAAHNSLGKLLCDPISEVSDTGEEILLYLFSIPKGTYTGRIQDYYLEIRLVEPGGATRTHTLSFYERKEEVND